MVFLCFPLIVSMCSILIGKSDYADRSAQVHAMYTTYLTEIFSKVHYFERLVVQISKHEQITLSNYTYNYVTYHVIAKSYETHKNQ